MNILTVNELALKISEAIKAMPRQKNTVETFGTSNGLIVVPRGHSAMKQGEK